MSALSTEEQELLDWLKSSIPRWLWMDDQAQEAWAAVAKSLAVTRAQILDWNNATFILQATDIWLDQHAKDRGAQRQSNESDPALRSRIRNPQEALTRQSILDAANLIIAGEGIIGTAAMVELPRDAASLGSWTSDTGTGGEFTLVTGTQYAFTPTVPFACVPFIDPSLVRMIQGYQLAIAGAGNPSNNGTFPILGMNLDGAVIDNGTAVAGVEAGCTWTVQKLDRQGNAIDGFGRAYASRGFRCTHKGKPPTIVLILPFGSTVSTLSSVNDMLRQKKAAGYKTIVERRQSP